MKFNNIIMFVIILLLGLSSVYFFRDQEEVLYDSILENNEAQSLLSDYGITLDLPKEWAGYTVFLSLPEKDSPNHQLMEKLDENYFLLNVRHPNWQKGYQDISLACFRTDQWNENASEATGDNVYLLPTIISFSEKYVFSLDPYYYNQANEGYDAIINTLINMTYYPRNRAMYDEMDIVSIASVNTMYKKDTNALSVKWNHILRDDIKTTGAYFLEVKSGDVWQEKANYAHGDIYVITRDDDDITQYAIDSLEIGEYRLGIEYELMSFIGLALNDTYTYRVYTNITVGETDILKENTEDTLEGVGLETEYEVYTEGVTEIRAKWYNLLDDEMMYGEYFSLQKKVNDTWENIYLPNKEDIAFISIGYSLMAQTEKWQNFNISIYSKGLEKGEYRLSTRLSRMTLNGVDFGAGNYPDYQIFSYFTVGDHLKERQMTNLHSAYYIYKNAQYNFVMYLPKDWEGLTLIEKEPSHESPLNDLLVKLDSDYSILRLRHPDLSENYQDIVLTVIQREQWNANANSSTNGNLELLPKKLFSNREYLFAFDPYHYNKKLEKYDEVMEVIENIKIY